jgi:membrane-associated phospholipid phosphatase
LKIRFNKKTCPANRLSPLTNTPPKESLWENTKTPKHKYFMTDFTKKQWFYLTLFGLFVVFGGIYLSMSTKGGAILFFSDHRSPLGDAFFKNATLLGEAYLYFIIALAMLAVRLRYTLLVAITGFVVMGVSFGLKSLFQQDRPFAFFRNEGLIEKINLVQGVDLHTGATSLPSGHTMSAFALYGLLAFLLPNRKRFAAPLFLLALLVGFSRIYLVQHFWVDVYWGAITGTLLAMIIYTVNTRFPFRPDHAIDRPLVHLKRRKWAAG